MLKKTEVARHRSHDAPRKSIPGRGTLVLVVLFMLLAANSFFYITSSWAQRYDDDDDEEALKREREVRETSEINEMAFSIIFWILLGGSSAYIVARGLRR